jgi:hypothetical protein
MVIEIGRVSKEKTRKSKSSVLLNELHRSAWVVIRSTIGYLQGKYVLNEPLLLVNEKAATVRLPRDNIAHPVFLELVEHVVQLDWKVLFATVHG